MQAKKKKVIKMIASNFFQNQRNLSDFHIKFKEVDFWECVLNNYDNFLKKKLKKKNYT